MSKLLCGWCGCDVNLFLYWNPHYIKTNILNKKFSACIILPLKFTYRSSLRLCYNKMHVIDFLIETSEPSLFSVVHDSNISANELNNDLQKISEWAYKWKMSLNPDLNKQAQGVIFSRKLNNPYPIKQCPCN